MKYLLPCIGLLMTATVYGQDEFAITANGLAPPFLTSKIDHLTKSQMYEKTLTWIEENEEAYKLSVQGKTENAAIQLTSVKWNAVNLGEKYFIARHHISLSFEDDHWKFEPTAIQLKLNSKYDMGWEDFDLTDGTMYFKKGKLIKKYKSYLDDLLAQLNEINMKLKSSISGS